MSVFVRKRGSEERIFVAGLGRPGPPGPGGGETTAPLPTGGEVGQLLAKRSAEDYDTHWVDPPEVGGEGSGGTGESPGVTSFKDRSGAVQPLAGDYTAEMVGARPDTWFPTAAQVGALPSGTLIPSKTSDLTNDSGFVTSETLNAAIQAAILDSWEGSY